MLTAAPPRPDPAERLLARYAATREPALREQLVTRYLPLARHAAGAYAGRREPFDDLQQVASIGLLKAIERWDPSRGVAFSSFALPTINGEIRRYFRDRTWAVRPPRDLLEDALRIERLTDELTRDLGRSPTIAELAERAGLDEEAVLDARQAMQARGATSLSAPGSGDDGPTTLEAFLGHEDAGLHAAEQRATIDALLLHLTPRERRIVRLRFEEDLTQREVGEQVGLSQMHVSRTLRRAMAKLHRAVQAAPPSRFAVGSAPDNPRGPVLREGAFSS